MRHKVDGYKLGRTSSHRRVLFRNLAAGLFQHGQILTTLPKAKAVQPFAEKLITLARQGDLYARRRAIALLQDRDLATVEKQSGDPVFEEQTVIQKLFNEVGPAYSDRAGGYTRIVRAGKHRVGDGADLVVLQLVGNEEGPRVGGRYSRRRQKQDQRTAFAARRRRERGKATQPAAAGETESAAEDTEASGPSQESSEEESGR